MGTSTDIWLQASSDKTQRLAEDNVGQVVIIDRIDGASNASLDTRTGAVTIESDADYLIVAAPQVGREHSGDMANFRCWLRANGVNIPDSNVLLNLPSVDTKDVIVCQVLVHLEANVTMTITPTFAWNSPIESIAPPKTAARSPTT